MEKKLVLDFKYDYVDNSRGEELVIVGRTDKNNSVFYKYGFVDCYGNEVVPCVYDKVGEFRDGIAPVYINGKGWGIISKDEVLVAPKYLFLHPQVGSAIREQARDGFVVFENSKGKYACLSKEDKWVPFEYDDITLYGFSHEGLICVGKNIEDAKLLGLLDKDGKEILPCKYKSISKFENGVASVEIDGNKYWINKEGNEVSQPEVTETKSVFEEYEVVERDGKYGIVDKDGNAITPFKYDRIETQNVYRPNIIRFFDGYICVRINDLRGLVNEKGEEVVPCKHEVIQNISNGMFVSLSYSAGKKFGLYDTKGNEILPVIYSFIHIFENGLVFVQKGSKYALIGVPSETAKEPEKKSKVKKVKAPLKYSEIGTFSEGLVSVKGKYYGFIDKDGNEVLTTDYVYGGKGGFDAADMFVDGKAIVKKGGRYGFIDKDGNEVIPCNYSEAYRFSDGVARVREVGKGMDKQRMYGFINKEANEVIPMKYISAQDFSEGLAAVKIDGKWGFIDASDKEVLPFKYDNAMSFSEGLAAVKIDGKWGFIDKNGNEVIPCRYDEVSSFSEGRASVMANNKYGFIDKEGNEVIPCKYDGVGSYSEGFASVFSKFRYGYIDMAGNEVIPCKYFSAAEFKDGLAKVSIDEKYGLINKNDELVVPFSYDDITIGDEYIGVREGKKCGITPKNN